MSWCIRAFNLSNMLLTVQLDCVNQIYLTRVNCCEHWKLVNAAVHGKNSSTAFARWLHLTESKSFSQSICILPVLSNDFNYFMLSAVISSPRFSLLKTAAASLLDSTIQLFALSIVKIFLNCNNGMDVTFCLQEGCYWSTEELVWNKLREISSAACFQKLSMCFHCSFGYLIALHCTGCSLLRVTLRRFWMRLLLYTWKDSCFKLISLGRIISVSLSAFLWPCLLSQLLQGHRAPKVFLYDLMAVGKKLLSRCAILFLTVVLNYFNDAVSLSTLLSVSMEKTICSTWLFWSLLCLCCLRPLLLVLWLHFFHMSNITDIICSVCIVNCAW